MQRMVVLAAALAVLSSTAAATAQSVDEIVARHIAARGGYDRIKAVQTIKLTRTVATTFSDVRVVIYKKRPALYRLEQGPLTPGAPMVSRIVNPDGAWDVQGGKAVPRSAALAAESRDLEADFDGLLVDWKQKGHTVTLEGRETLASGEAFKLKVVTKSGAERLVFLDAATYLERRHTGLLRLPGGREFSVVIDFDNYKPVDGVLFPHDINEERSGKEPVQSLVVYTEKIELNVPLDDGLFAPPKSPQPE
jgi:hypothetical protein